MFRNEFEYNIRKRFPLRPVILAIIIFSSHIPMARAQINPWISNLYDSKKWDSAGPRTGTPWLHPPEWTPGQGWGVFTGNMGTAGALTGSWGGLRDRLEEKGIQLYSSFLGQLAVGSIGREDLDASWRSDISTFLYLDLERLVNWKGGYFITSIRYLLPGDNYSSDLSTELFPVQLITGVTGADWRYVHLGLGQQFFDNKAELVLGRIITGEDFATLRLACTSLNQGICGNPILAVRTISFPSYPYAVWGARFKVKPGTRWYAQVGSYMVFEDFRQPEYDFDFSIPSGAGPLTIGEAGFIVGNHVYGTGLPGRYKAGGYYDAEDVTEQGSNRTVKGTWGIYIMAEQMLYSENKSYSEGLSAFLSLSYAPEDRNKITFMAAAGLSYQGLIPNRSNDILAFVFGYGLYSNDLARFNRRNDDPVVDYETLIEFNYRIQITQWLFLQPDFQIIINPNGQPDKEDEFVMGLGVGTIY